MALAGPELATLKQLDRMAYVVGRGRALATDGTSLWTAADSAADETYENRMKGLDTTAADAAIAGLNIGELEAIRTWVDNLRIYCTTDLGYAGIDAYLTAKALRVDGKAAQILRQRGISLTAVNCGGDADAGATAPGVSLGNLTRGGAIASAADISALYGESPIVARVTALGASDWTLSVTCKRLVGTTTTVAQVVNGTGAGGVVGDTYVIGKQAISAEAAAGQKVVSMVATGQFLAGEYVLLTEWSGDAPNQVLLQQEIIKIDTVQANTSLTALANLKHTYSAGIRSFAYPCYRGVTAASGSGGTAGGPGVFLSGRGEMVEVVGAPFMAPSARRTGKRTRRAP